MTAFTKENLIINGDYIYYHPHADNFWEGRTFVARFKHRGPVTKAKFRSMLIKHYSVEEYFARLGGAYNPKGEAPLQILMNDGVLVFEKDELDRSYFILDGKRI